MPRAIRPPLSSAARQLAADHANLAYYFARQKARRIGPKADLDELLSQAHLALVTAAGNFDPDLPGSFVAYASVCIRFALRKRDRRRGIPFSQLGGEDDDRAFDPADHHTPTPDRESTVRELIGLVQLATSPREVVCLHLHFIEGYSMTEISELWECSTESVSSCLSAAVRRARCELPTEMNDLDSAFQCRPQPPVKLPWYRNPQWGEEFSHRIGLHEKIIECLNTPGMPEEEKEAARKELARLQRAARAKAGVREVSSCPFRRRA